MSFAPHNPASSQSLAQVTYLVREYEEAIEFFVQKLGFSLLEDADMGSGRRWVVVAPPGSSGAALLLARAATHEQAACVGNQSGGRVFLFLHTDNFRRDHASMLTSGVRFLESPRTEPYGTVAVFEDLYGNKWDLLEPASNNIS